MGRWLEKSRKVSDSVLTKLPIPSSVSFGSDHTNGFQEKTTKASQSIDEILNRHSLNMAAIERGRTLWKQPFDDDDLNDIEAGVLSLDQVDQYLTLWKGQHPEQYQALKVAKVIPIQKPAEDALGSLDDLALLREDHDFIKTKLMRLPRAQWPELIRQYREAWATASINHMAGISADNAGRRAANTWLRELVAKRFSFTVEG